MEVQGEILKIKLELQRITVAKLPFIEHASKCHGALALVMGVACVWGCNKLLREVECWQYFSSSLLLPTSSSDSPLKLWVAWSTAVLLQWHLYQHIPFIVKADFCSSPSGGFPLPALHAGLTKAGSPIWQAWALHQSTPQILLLFP